MSANKPKKEGCEVCILTLIFLSIFLGKEADVVDTEMQGKAKVTCPVYVVGSEAWSAPKYPGVVSARSPPLGRQSQLDFPTHQPWIKTSGRSLDIIDQTRETIRSYYDGDPLDDKVVESLSPRPSYTSHEPGTSTISSFANKSLAACYANTIIPDVVINKATVILNSPESDTSAHPDARLDSFGNLPLSPPFSGFSPPTTDSRPCPDSIAAPIIHPGYLDDLDDLDITDVASRQKLESFLELVGPAIDPCDQYAALAAEIVERALIIPQLLSPVMQLGEIRDLGVAIPFHVSPDMNGHLLNGVDKLVAAFLYRILDNLRGLATESTSFDRMKLIRDATEHLALCPDEESGFVHRLIWASLQQEIFITMMNHEDTCLDIDEASLRALRSTSEDEEWTNRMFLQLISTVQHCFGDGKSSASYDKLVDSLASWVQQRPATFQPIFFQPARDGQTFPEIWFLNHFAAVASQYYLIARIMLIVHNPRMPRLGPAKRDAAKCRDDQVRSDVRIICGIAVSQQAVNPRYL
ncbi:unnamed protein product [Clonostachys rosea f. rosea IK726]|uniref:Uncharacterized protein n=1 Tax=Clonostachys rosea f. rosea IK726 TaxID=1349383 RepID=A0ACA9TFP8_BIOOC|nr:unnamed protein product [Clonostachys rosea f. rosea IK726]